MASSDSPQSRQPQKRAPRKKRYVERPNVREVLLDAAEALIREEGYAAATARAIASRVGMKHQAVFYYFGSQDELLLAVLKRSMEAHKACLKEALESENPIREMWNLAKDTDHTKLGLEFMALANHNEAIRAEIASNARQLRKLEAKAIESYLEKRGIEPRLSPQVVSILTHALARLLVQEASLGIRVGHKEIEALVDFSFTTFEAQGDMVNDVAPIVDAIAPSNK